MLSRSLFAKSIMNEQCLFPFEKHRKKLLRANDCVMLRRVVICESMQQLALLAAAPKL
jgi:hypothetical protein